MAHGSRAVVALAALGLAALAPTAQGNDRAELGVTLGTQTPGAPTSLAFRVLYKSPSDPGGKPPALTRAAFKLPPGTRFDTRATPTCDATNQELQARGRAACPPASIIGTGSLTAVTGFGPPADPFEADLTAFNGGTELIELVTVKGSNVGAGVDRLTIEDSTLRAHPPSTPGGPPDGRTAIREVRLNVPARGRLVTAPPSCPANAAWTSVGEFGFNDGGSTSVTATSPCRPDGRRPCAYEVVRLAPASPRRSPDPAPRARPLERGPLCARGDDPGGLPPWPHRSSGPWHPALPLRRARTAPGHAPQARLPPGARLRTGGASLASTRCIDPTLPRSRSVD